MDLSNLQARSSIVSLKKQANRKRPLGSEVLMPAADPNIPLSFKEIFSLYEVSHNQ